MIEYIFSHSYEYFELFNQKPLLKEYLSSDFGDAFLNRKKQGFVFDIKNFVYTNDEFFRENIINSNKIPYIKTKKIVNLFKFKTRVNSNRIWKLYVLNYYLDQL